MSGRVGCLAARGYDLRGRGSLANMSLCGREYSLLGNMSVSCLTIFMQ